MFKNINHMDYYTQSHLCYQENITSEIQNEMYEDIVISVLQSGGFYSDNGMWIYCNDRKAIMIPLDIRVAIFKKLQIENRIQKYTIQAYPKHIQCNFDILYPGKVNKNGDVFGAVGLFCLPEFMSTLSMTFHYPLIENEVLS